MTSILPPGKHLLMATAFLACGMSTAGAGFIDFNPTGSGAGPGLTIAGFDLAPGSALARNALPLVKGQTFQLDYQATTSGFIDKNGLTSAPAGLGSSYQITAMASFTEVVKSVNATNHMATFGLAATQAPNSFFELYYNPKVVADNLAGTGFNAGTLILSATPAVKSANVGLFSLANDPSTGSPQVQPFDQYLTNHYPTTSTVVGSGSSLLSTNVNYINTDFFKTDISQIAFNTSLVTPFGQTSPSSRFTDFAGAGAPDVTPDLGSVNGLDGKDFQFQADANFSFTSVSTSALNAVPEPASIIQAALGLLAALGGVAWKASRKRKAKYLAPLA